MSQTAYAVAVEKRVQVATVHFHARGAMVNFLCTEVEPWNTPQGQQRMASLPDTVIRDMFVSLCASYPQVELAVVSLVATRYEDPAGLADVTAPPLDPPRCLPSAWSRDAVTAYW